MEPRAQRASWAQRVQAQAVPAGVQISPRAVLWLAQCVLPKQRPPAGLAPGHPLAASVPCQPCRRGSHAPFVRGGPMPHLLEGCQAGKGSFLCSTLRMASEGQAPALALL